MLRLIAGVIRGYGLFGVGILMLIENLIPIIPSEIIMPLAGFEAAQGAIDPWAAILAGTVGSTIGGAAWYLLARRLGVDRFALWADRYGRWLAISRQDVVKAQHWFKRWGALGLFVGRALPGVRGVVCVPAGLARIPLATFLACSSLGALVWTCLLTFAGFVLKANFARLEQWTRPITAVFLGVCLTAYLVRIFRSRLSLDPTHRSS